jgi:3-methyladenine DNA glycosylase Mpg
MPASRVLVYPDDDGVSPAILTTPRIGITKAADWPLRFHVEGSPFVSGSRRGAGEIRLPTGPMP